MKQLRKPYGFTLIEVIVVSIIGAVIAGMFIAFMRVHNDTLAEGAALSRMQLQSDLVSAEIARKVRNASKVVAFGEAYDAWSTGTVWATSIVLYNKAGNTIGAYGIDSLAERMLKESSDGLTYKPFKAGSDTVRMAAGSGFKLSPDRKQVILNLLIKLQYKNKPYQTVVKGDMYACRN